MPRGSDASSRTVRETFLLDVVTAAAIAMTSISPEMVGRGVALTGRTEDLDAIESIAGDVLPIDSIDFGHARELASHWPWE
jgi:hypothetical protein